MRGLTRLLMMFGPMIFRQFQKYQRNKARQQPQQLPNRPIENSPRSNRQSNRQSNDNRGEQIEYKDLNAELGRSKERQISPEERDFKLSEDDIMLDNDDLKHYKANDITTHSKAAIEKAVDEKIELLQGPAKEAAQKAKKEAIENDLDLRKLFLE